MRAHTCDVVRVRAVRKLGVRFACMRPEEQIATHLWRFLNRMVCAKKSSLISGLDVGMHFLKLTLLVTVLTASYCLGGHKKSIAAHSNYFKKINLNLNSQTITIFIILDLRP